MPAAVAELVKALYLDSSTPQPTRFLPTEVGDELHGACKQSNFLLGCPAADSPAKAQFVTGRRLVEEQPTFGNRIQLAINADPDARNQGIRGVADRLQRRELYATLLYG